MIKYIIVLLFVLVSFSFVNSASALEILSSTTSTLQLGDQITIMCFDEDVNSNEGYLYWLAVWNIQDGYFYEEKHRKLQFIITEEMTQVQLSVKCEKTEMPSYKVLETAYTILFIVDENNNGIPDYLDDIVTEEIENPITEEIEDPITEEIEDPITEEIEDPIKPDPADGSTNNFEDDLVGDLDYDLNEDLTDDFPTNTSEDLTDDFPTNTSEGFTYDSFTDCVNDNLYSNNLNVCFSPIVVTNYSGSILKLTYDYSGIYGMTCEAFNKSYAIDSSGVALYTNKGKTFSANDIVYENAGKYQEIPCKGEISIDFTYEIENNTRIHSECGCLFFYDYFNMKYKMPDGDGGRLGITSIQYLDLDFDKTIFDSWTVDYDYGANTLIEFYLFSDTIETYIVQESQAYPDSGYICGVDKSTYFQFTGTAQNSDSTADSPQTLSFNLSQIPFYIDELRVILIHPDGNPVYIDGKPIKSIASNVESTATFEFPLDERLVGEYVVVLVVETEPFQQFEINIMDGANRNTYFEGYFL